MKNICFNTENSSIIKCTQYKIGKQELFLVTYLQEHMLVYHEDALVPGYTKSKGSYFEDDDPDNPSEVFVCEICEDFRTNSRNKLAAHNVAVHPKGKLSTMVCEMSYEFYYSL